MNKINFLLFRKVMMLVKAGSAVDSFITQLVPLLEKGDIIIDGGNSEYQDTRYQGVQYSYHIIKSRHSGKYFDNPELFGNICFKPFKRAIIS